MRTLVNLLHKGSCLFQNKLFAYGNSGSSIIKRNFKAKAAYEGEAKTVMRLLNQDAELGLMINSYSQVGFSLNNGVSVIGPIAIFPKTVLSWNVPNIDAVNEASLSLFYTLEPKLDILILGTGVEKVPTEFYKKLVGIMRDKKISVEILKTEQACTTFNFLNAESRNVAAALFPPLHLTVTDDDMLRTKIRRRKLESTEE